MSREEAFPWVNSMKPRSCGFSFLRRTSRKIMLVRHTLRDPHGTTTPVVDAQSDRRFDVAALAGFAPAQAAARARMGEMPVVRN